MKKTTRWLSLLLALVLLVSALPVAVLAEGSGTETPPPPPPTYPVITAYAVLYSNTAHTKEIGKWMTAVYKDKESVKINSGTFGGYLTYNGGIYEYVGVSYNNKIKGSVTIDADGAVAYCIYVPHTHDYRKGHNRIQHWEACACGSILSIANHVDPATDEDSICTCGYEFSDNANLVTLNLSNIVLECRVNDEKTEYLGKVHNYKPVTSSDVKYRTFDALATVDAPSVVSISEGMNVVEVTVTAEDRKTTKTYTVYAFLTPKVDGMDITYTSNDADGFEVVIGAKGQDRRGYVTLDLPKSAAEKVGLLLESTKAKNLVIEPSYNRWSNVETAVIIPSAILEQVGKTGANILIKNYSGNVEIPNSDMEKLAGAGEAVRFALIKEGDDVKLAVTADDKEVENTKIAVTAATRK